MMRKEYIGQNVVFHLDNGVSVFYFNDHTPLTFSCGLKEIGRYNLAASIYTVDEIVRFAEQANLTDIYNFFN